MTFTVYILENPDGKLYIGQTNNLTHRIEAHNDGLANYTSRFRGPWKIIYTEIFSTRSAAMQREKQLKKQKGGEVLRKIIRDS